MLAPLRRRRRGPTTLASDGTVVEAAAWCAELRPGLRVGLWYPRDTVWHERLLLYPAGGTYWWVLTPDADRYAEDVSGSVGDGCSRAFACAPDGTAPALAHGAFYRFAQAVPWEVLRAEVLASRTDQLAHAGGAALVDPLEVYTWTGAPRPFGDLRRRMPLRGAGPAVGGTDTPPGDAAPLADDGAPAAPAAAALEPPEGCAWLTSSPGRLRLGLEVVLETGSVRLDERHAMVKEEGVWQLVEAVRIGSVDAFRDSRPRQVLKLVEADLPADGRVGAAPSSEAAPAQAAAGTAGLGEGDKDLRDRLGVPAPEAAPEPDAGEDVRTLWVQHDERGERHKPWREVVREIKKYTFKDWPLEDGLSTVEHMAKRWEQSGGTPLLWLELWARDRLLNQSDRTYIEMKCLLSAIHYAGSYDQVNLASMASIEVLCRRVSQIVEAYSGDPNKPPKWGGLRHFMGVAGPMDVIDPALRTAVFRRNKEEMELENWKNRAAGVPVPSPLALEAGEGLPSGPSGGAGGRGRGRGDGRGRGTDGRGRGAPGGGGGRGAAGRGGKLTAPEEA